MSLRTDLQQMGANDDNNSPPPNYESVEGRGKLSAVARLKTRLAQFRNNDHPAAKRACSNRLCSFNQKTSAHQTHLPNDMLMQCNVCREQIWVSRDYVDIFESEDFIVLRTRICEGRAHAHELSEAITGAALVSCRICRCKFMVHPKFAHNTKDMTVLWLD